MIIEESETQVINLVLLIAKKVIKVISENQKNVVINNVVQALRKLQEPRGGGHPREPGRPGADHRAHRRTS